MIVINHWKVNGGPFHLEVLVGLDTQSSRGNIGRSHS